MRVLFWGTPEFAAPSLRALIGEGFDVVGAVTQPDKPRGRSRSQLVPPPVKQIALGEGIPVLQPERPRGDEFLTQLRELSPDISVVVAYGHILRREVVELPPLGTINVHASLLPALRGADPIRGALRAGLSETGVTIMHMVERLDAGPMILQMRTPVTDDMTYGELALRLSELGSLALVEALALISVGEAQQQPQDESLVTYAPKLTREDAHINWAQPADDVSRSIRACDPAPGAFTSHRGDELKLFAAKTVAGSTGRPGELLGINDVIVIACGEGAVQAAEVQPAGRRRMRVADWARGRGVFPGEVLGE